VFREFYPEGAYNFHTRFSSAILMSIAVIIAPIAYVIYLAYFRADGGGEGHFGGLSLNLPIRVQR
jgi:hypothetical protein